MKTKTLIINKTFRHTNIITDEIEGKWRRLGRRNGTSMNHSTSVRQSRYRVQTHLVKVQTYLVKRAFCLLAFAQKLTRVREKDCSLSLSECHPTGANASRQGAVPCGRTSNYKTP